MASGDNSMHVHPSTPLNAGPSWKEMPNTSGYENPRWNALLSQVAKATVWTAALLRQYLADRHVRGHLSVHGGGSDVDRYRDLSEQLPGRLEPDETFLRKLDGQRDQDAFGHGVDAV